VLGWIKLTNRLRSNGSGASVEFTDENCRWGKCWGISCPDTPKASYRVQKRPNSTDTLSVESRP